MNLLKKIESIKSKNISKIKMIPDIENVISKDNKMYGVKFFIFGGSFNKTPLVIRVLSKSKSFDKINTIEIYNQKMKPAIAVDLNPDIPEDKLLVFISKLPSAAKYKSLSEGNIVQEYLNSLILAEGGISKILTKIDPRMILNGILLVTALFAVIRYYILRIRNMKEEYESAGKREQEINQKLFKGQKYNDPAFKMYANLQNFIKYVALGKAPAVIICGPPGTSKTYIVRRTFYFEGLKPGSDYRIEKGGGLSVSAVYDLLFENRNRILILDDFDTPLRNEDTVNMLKAITDSYDKRILSISREKRMSSGQNQESSETPTKFEYKGKLVIVTNLKKSEIDRALLSRAPAFEVSFNNKEIIEALQIMLEYINPNVSMEIKKEVLDYILILHKKNPEIQIDFRAFKNSVDARVGNPLYWKEMIQTIVGYN
jgi:hypothetical protein